MSKHVKYAPKHRAVPTRSFTQAPKRALRNTVVLSSVAVAATGVAVSGGLLSARGTPGGGVSTAADDLGSSTRTPVFDDRASAPIDRDPVVSRSSDRREETDPAKKAALAVHEGPAVTHTVDIAQADPRQIAQALLPQFGFSSDQFGCLEALWSRESGWNPSAMNPSSGAYGIPQSLPGSKMATVASDWQTNPVTQIKWGLGYIRDSYGSPCGAWGHSESYGWY